MNLNSANPFSFTSAKTCNLHALVSLSSDGWGTEGTDIKTTTTVTNQHHSSQSTPGDK